MRVTRLSLRNFRVFSELDLELPPGVVGIYGANGAGKSTLVESILWALFGVARTGKDSLRSDGATGETEATVEFEHDGHLYEVTRSLSGAANGVKAEAACDGQRVAAEAALASAEQTEAAAAAVAADEERRKQERDRLAAAYAAARRRHEEAAARLATRCSELAELESAGERLPALSAAAADLGSLRSQLEALERRDAAQARLGAAERELAESTATEPGRAGPASAEGGNWLQALETLEEAAAAAGRRSGETTGRVAAAEAAVAAATRRLEAAASEARTAGALDPEAPCPLCGQELGAAFDEVQRHRDAARREAEATAAAADAGLVTARAEHSAAARAEQTATAALRRARRRHERCAALLAEIAAARDALDEAENLVAAMVPGAAGDAGRTDRGPGDGDGDPAGLRRRLVETEAARDAALQLEERLKAQPSVAAAVAAEEAAVAEAGDEAARLLAEGKALRFDADAHAAANAARAEAAQAVGRARAALTDARVDERGLSERLAERRARLDAEVARRAELAGRESEARHLGRLAELLGEFRNSLVGQVGPALSAHTSALFRELTDGRFDSLEVDGDSFELRVGSAGHPLDRHSGSETDLANLSLRVAIGEQVNLLSGGAVGLLVLDEVLGALDGEHRDRLLAALTRLGARFRQVLVVTHAAEVKEQLPYAIEVEPIGGGRSRAASATDRIRLAEVG